MTINQLAQQLGVTRQAIGNRLKRSGISLSQLTNGKVGKEWQLTKSGADMIRSMMTGKPNTEYQSIASQSYRTVENRCDQLQELLTAATTERNHVREQLTTVTGERDHLLQQLTSVTGERDHLLQQLTSVTGERDQMQRENDKLTLKLESLEDRLTHMEKDLEEKRDDLQIMRKERQALDNNLHALSMAVAANAKERLEKRGVFARLADWISGNRQRKAIDGEVITTDTNTEQEEKENENNE